MPEDSIPRLSVRLRRLVIFSTLVTALVSDATALPLRESLGMFESGAVLPQRCAADKMRGATGEVSRFQIMPSVWRQYSRSTDYDNPEVAWGVAQRVLQDRVHWFRTATGRKPDATELYLMWNKPGHFQAAGFDVKRVKNLFQQRAQRFANLCARS